MADEDRDLVALLCTLSLEALLPIFQAEELTMEVLSWMATDEDSSFVESMGELEISEEDASRLEAALRSPPTGGGGTPLLLGRPSEPSRAAASVADALANGAPVDLTDASMATDESSARLPNAEAPSTASLPPPASASATAAQVAAAASLPPPASASATAAQVAAAAAIAAAAKAPAITPKWTPDGPKMVPADNMENIMAALAAVGAARRPAAAAGLAGQPDALAAALASVAAIDTSTSSALSEHPPRPKVKSATQINHVGTAASSKPSSVGRGTANRALEAYQRRQVYDPNRGVDAYELDQGTMNAEGRARFERQMAREKEAKYRDKNAFVGEHYNDI
jgi:hypothetical protein